jgi:hypothetical protein
LILALTDSVYLLTQKLAWSAARVAATAATGATAASASALRRTSASRPVKASGFGARHTALLAHPKHQGRPARPLYSSICGTGRKWAGTQSQPEARRRGHEGLRAPTGHVRHHDAEDDDGRSQVRDVVDCLVLELLAKVGEESGDLLQLEGRRVLLHLPRSTQDCVTSLLASRLC